MTMDSGKRYLVVPDLLKGLVILWIVMFHVYKDFPDVFCSSLHWLTNLQCRIIMHGALGVDIFIILSGYLLATSRLRNPQVHWFSFLRKRIWRIFPLYWFALAAILTLETVIGSSEESLNLPSVLYHLAGLHGFTSYIFDLQGAWWFVTLILQLYLLFPVIWYLSEKLPLYVLLILAACCTVSARFIPFANLDGNYSVFAFLPDFVFGLVMARKLSPNLQCSFSFTGGLYCIVAMIALIIGIYNDSVMVFKYGWGLFRPFVSSGLFLTLCCLCHHGIIRIPAVTYPLSKYGRHSYAIYLFHRPLIYKWVTLSLPVLPPVLVSFVFVAAMLPMGMLIEVGESRLLKRFNN
ncbi:MAG TPA: acyltransferase [Desulfocapsa sulfexigens]|nr:acyltransferase [Desulfocapsa sulfexigens]